MSISLLQLWSGSDSTGGASTSSGSVNPKLGTLMVALVHNRHTAASTSPQPTISDTNGNVWTVAVSHDDGFGIRASIYWAPVTNATAGDVVTLNAGQATADWIWSLVQLSGASVLLAGASADNGVGTGTSGSVTLPAYKSSDDLGLGIILVNDVDTITVGSGWTADANAADTQATFCDEYKLNGGSPSWTWVNATQYVAAAAEVLAARPRPVVPVAPTGAVVRAGSW